MTDPRDAGLPEDVNSCSYYCDRTECIKRQRDELRDRIAELERDLTTEERVRKSRDREYSELAKGFDSAKSELAAMKKWIAEAPKARVHGADDGMIGMPIGPHVLAYMADEDVGKDVALVVLDAPEGGE
ncbi:MAG: hypothetical protein KGL35_10635 [Bradyrhizobium sp.]|nr:hypothetical protein [Bradyrhizobium sp.]